MQQIPVLANEIDRVKPRLAGTSHRHQRSKVFGNRKAQVLASKVCRQGAVNEGQQATCVGPRGVQFTRQQPTTNLINGPSNRRDGRDTETLVDLGSVWVINSRHHRGNTKCSRAIRAVKILELSPLVTAASAAAWPTPASASASRSKPDPSTFEPGKSGPRRRNCFLFLSTTATEWPSATSSRARPEPTRPQPTMTMCIL